MRPSTTCSPRRSNLARYAIGDLQGCYEPLARLLDAVRFDPAKDRLWFVGDLVNRGPDSLRCLRFVKGLGAAAVTVLGNHDLHLVTIAEGLEPPRRRDTLDDVLDAPDRDELLAWLRHRPLLHVEDGFALVHAGLLPGWSVARAQELAGEVTSRLRGPDYRSLLADLYGDEPARWSDNLQGTARLRFVVNAMTRMRVLDADGAIVHSFKGKPAEARGSCTPWFDAPGRRNLDHTVVFGHWSALGLLLRPDVLGLDSGCVWGRALTAVRLEDREVASVRCPAVEGAEG